MTRDIHEIAKEIRSNWKNPHVKALRYLLPMAYLKHPIDTFAHDTGKDIILKFLQNASLWRGEKARQIKKELRHMIK
jgi:hypothetical protein